MRLNATQERGSADFDEFFRWVEYEIDSFGGFDSSPGDIVLAKHHSEATGSSPNHFSVMWRSRWMTRRCSPPF